MIEKATGYALAAGVIVTAVVTVPPVAVFAYGLAVVTRPTMLRFHDMIEAEAERRERVAA